MLLSFDGKSPRLGESVFVESTARVIGDVEIGPESSVWFQTVVRGDVHFIRIGARTNLQDHTMVHVAKGRHPTIIGDDVTVGHRVVLHGCTIGNRSLIGIGAIVMDGVEIGDECLIGAGALVAPRTIIPSGHLALGQPAKVVRPLRPEEIEKLRKSAIDYCRLAATYEQAQPRRP